MNDLDKNLDTSENTEDLELRIYEIGYHIVPTVSEDNLPYVVDTIKESIELLRGLVVSGDSPKSVDLAYSMDHIVANKKTIFDIAYFGWIKFEVNPENILKIKDFLEKNENILRFLIIKTVKESTLSKKPGIKSKQTAGIYNRKKDIKSMESDDSAPKKKDVISEEEVDKAIEELVV